MNKIKLKNAMICFILVNISVLVSFMIFNYYSNSSNINEQGLNVNNKLSNDDPDPVENNFYISSVANTGSIQVSYEPIKARNVAWPVKIYYKIYENNNIIKQGSYNYDYTKNQQTITINIERKNDKEYKIISEIKDKDSKIVNKSSLKIQSLSSIKGDSKDFQNKPKQTLSFKQEIGYIRNNINDLVSNFQEKPNNGKWYVVDIRFIKSSDMVAKSEDGILELYTDVVVIFEDGHNSYLARIKKNQYGYEAVGFYNFIQRPNQKIGWREIGTNKYLEIGEVIHHWSIRQ